MILATLALAAATPLPSREREGAPQARKGEGAQVAAIDQVVRNANLAGEVLVARGDRILLDRAYGTVAPNGGPKHKVGARWRLASITKQVTAAQVLQEYDRGGEPAPLDLPLPREFFGAAGGLTLRQLLTHHSGLANPDDTPPNAAGVPNAYLSSVPPILHCFSKPATPGAPFAYNNCDYLLAGSFRTGNSYRGWPAGMTMARSGERGVPGFVGGKPEPDFQLSSFHTAGGLIGTARSVFAFDRQLMTGKLLKPASLAELWKPEGGRSYQALGQWVFPGKLAGCAAPKRIVQRDGEIFGVQTRNFIFPDDDLVVVVFTNRGSDDFKFGEVWEGEGFTYDLLAAAACPPPTN